MDPDPGGPKTCGSESGSPTLVFREKVIPSRGREGKKEGQDVRQK
jgi:hypothetical protein